jgi:hypothetical protein
MAKSLGSANAVIGLDNIRLIKKTKQWGAEVFSAKVLTVSHPNANKLS